MAATSTRDPGIARSAAGLGGVADRADAPPLAAMTSHDLAAWYREHFAFVWRMLRRLGVPTQNLDDSAQDVFVIVHRRLPDFDPAASVRAWLFGIARRVAQQQRRKLGTLLRTADELVEHEHSATQLDPQQAAMRAEAASLVHRCLASLDEEKRWVLILSDLEAMSGPEIAQALDLNLNTTYARLRAARKQFVANVRREQARAKEDAHD
jgi:RNA polymerase sigma-70 factor (ECF subfamily)